MIKSVQEMVSAAKATQSCLSIESAQALLSDCHQPFLLDVREPQEHQLDSLDGFINIPRGVLEMRMPELCADPDRCILIHCATGGRAALSAKTLCEMGYRNVHTIDAPFDMIKARFQTLLD